MKIKTIIIVIYISLSALFQNTAWSQTNYFIHYDIYKVQKTMDNQSIPYQISCDIKTSNDTATCEMYISEQQIKDGAKKGIEKFLNLDSSAIFLNKNIKIKNQRQLFGTEDTYFASKENKAIWYIDTLEAIKWNLGTKSKVIDSLLCYDAYASFRGRNYAVWYCPDIPISYGPWKLDGCPGLIVEFSDDKNYFIGKLIYLKSTEEKINPTIPKKYFNYPDYNKIIQTDATLYLRKFNQIKGASCLDCKSTLSYTITNFEYSYNSKDIK